MFSFLAFGDLHVNADTLDRSVQVLRTLGQSAAARGAPIVCTGDFWDARGVMATRQVDAVLSEIEEWGRLGVKAIMIPGNHDQVTVKGKIHALRIFDAFPHVLVATEPLLDHANRVAFLPWREDPQDQATLFNLPGAPDWTIFAHAEVKGAASNNGHPAPGRVSLGQIHSVARACYLGHYHKRQKIGDRTWYLGNPFEIHMGERGQPKGLAFITSDQVDPVFAELPGMRKHHRIDLRASAAMPSITAADVVEIVGPKDMLRDPEIVSWIQSLPSQDVRQRPVAEEWAEGTPPPIAGRLEDALEAHVEAHHEGDEEVLFVGQSILREAQNAEKRTEPFGSKCRVLEVRGRDFCALQGDFVLPLADQGAVMIRGPQGAGKTAFVDSITWCLFDQTSPRRPGGEASSLRGDDVIHGHKDSVAVTTVLEVDGQTFEVLRKKERGKGSRVRVKGPYSRPDGILDDSAWVESLVGVPYPLWRSCVSLGQGAVANFLTQTDKNRKAVLNDAFGLSVCEPARKIAKKRHTAVDRRIAEKAQEQAKLHGVVQYMETQDFSEEEASWEGNKEGKKAALLVLLDDAKKRAADALQALSEIENVEELATNLDTQIAELEKNLVASPKLHRKQQDLQKAVGAAEAERAMVERDLALLQQEIQNLEASGQGKAAGECPTCHQSWPHANLDHHIADMRAKAKSKEFEINTLTARVGNAEMELAGIAGNVASERALWSTEIEALREKRKVVAQAQHAASHLRHNIEQAEGEVEASKEELAELEGSDNPWTARVKEQEEEIEMQRAALDDVESELQEAHQEREILRVWVDGFGQNGLPVTVLRSAMGDLEASANKYLHTLTEGKIWAELSLAGDALDVTFHELSEGVWWTRRYEQLSGGQRRCAELAFSPFGLSDMIFRRLKCKVPLMIVDELTTHVGPKQKGLVCDVIHALDRETVVVIDHDPTVQGEFDVVYEVQENADGTKTLVRL